MTQRSLLLVVLISLVLSLAACGSRGGKTPEPSEPAAAQPAGAQSSEEPTAAPTATTQPTSRPEPTATVAAAEAPTDISSDELNLENRGEGLDQLTSYRLKWTSEWVPDDTTQQPMSMEWIQDYVAQPPAQYLEWRATNLNDTTADQAMLSRLWHIGPTTYMMMGTADQAQCIAITQDEEASAEPPFNPSLLGSVEGAKYAGRETVNGIPTKHYIYSNIAFTLLGAKEVSGEVWVAEDGGYMVQEKLSWKGGAGPFTSQSEGDGTGSWTWELSNVNEPLTIEPPEECTQPAGGLAGIPILPDAQSKLQMPTGSQYASKTSVADATKFYQQQMPAAGWQPDGDPTVMGEMAILAFTKGDQKVNVMITGDGDGGSVVILSTE